LRTIIGSFILFAVMYMISLLRWQSFQEVISPNIFFGSEEAPIRSMDLSVFPDSYGESCKNSVQGKNLMSDSRGFVCFREDLNQTSGCCSLISVMTAEDLVKNKSKKNGRAKLSKRFDCNNCVQKHGCCQEYEYCISCCLKPENLQKYLSLYMSMPLLKRKVPSNSKTYRTLDSFDYCSHVCRTSSQSVQSENSYRGMHNHCFSQKQAIIEKNPVNSDRAGFLKIKKY
jgi:hypothetical protein